MPQTPLTEEEYLLRERECIIETSCTPEELARIAERAARTQSQMFDVSTGTVEAL